MDSEEKIRDLLYLGQETMQISPDYGELAYAGAIIWMYGTSAEFGKPHGKPSISYHFIGYDIRLFFETGKKELMYNLGAQMDLWREAGHRILHIWLDGDDIERTTKIVPKELNGC